MKSGLSHRLITGAIVGVFGLVLWGYVVGPLVYTLRESLAGEGGPLFGYIRLFREPTEWRAIVGSIEISSLSVITAGAVGVFLAVSMNRWDSPLKSVCRVLILMPLALPSLIGSESFVLLYGVGGLFPKLLAMAFHADPNSMALRGIPGVLLVHTFTMYPYFYLSTAAALAQTDDSLEEAAHSLGASRFQTWTRVRLPMLTPALVAGALLTFMSSMGSYSAPLLFQADEVATVQIVQFRERNNLRLASALSVILALTSVIFLIILRGYERRADHRRQSKGAIHKRQPITHPIAKAALGVSVPMAAVLMTLPVAMIFLCAFMVEGSWQTSVLPSRYTMQNFAAVFHDARSWNVVIDSLQITTIALAGTILFGVACAYAITRLDFRGKRVLDILIMLPWALPGSVIAIDLIVAFNRPSLFGLGQTLVGTFAILPLAYFVRFSPLIFRSTTASLSQLDPNLDQAARSLGGTWWQAFRRVVLPLLSRGIMAGALLVFVSGIGEFVASMLLYGASGKPISVGIWEQYGNGHVGTSAALGVVQILLVSVLLVVSQSLERSRAMSARQVPTGRAARRIAALG